MGCMCDRQIKVDRYLRMGRTHCHRCKRVLQPGDAQPVVGDEVQGTEPPTRVVEPEHSKETVKMFGRYEHNE